MYVNALFVSIYACLYGGEGGIRTHVPVTRQDAFEAPPLRPLRYLSGRVMAPVGATHGCVPPLPGTQATARATSVARTRHYIAGRRLAACLSLPPGRTRSSAHPPPLTLAAAVTQVKGPRHRVGQREAPVGRRRHENNSIVWRLGVEPVHRRSAPRAEEHDRRAAAPAR